MQRLSSLPIVFVAVLFSAVGCSSNSDLGVDGNGDGGNVGDGGAGNGDSGILDPNFCQGGGSVAPESCLSTTSFRFAICSCEDFVSSNAITTDSFDSSQSTSNENGGSIGLNGGVNLGAPATVGGAFYIAGANGVTTSSTVEVVGHIKSGGNLAGDSYTARGDAYVAGDVSVNSLTVDGTLTLPADSQLNAAASSVASTTRAPVVVDPPCDCDGSRVDVEGIIAEGATVADNDAINLPTDALVNVQGTEQFTLPCGRYLFDAVQGSGSVELVLTGRVVLLIDGPISLNGDFNVSLQDGAEVDIFVAENINVSGALNLGDVAAPSLSRVYVGGNGSINLSSGAQVAGNIFAPTAELVTAGDVELFGSIQARRISTSGALDVHFDTAILEGDDECVSDEPCTSCEDCNNQACNDGECGACETDADCCAPLVCNEFGECIAEIIIE